MKPTWTEQMRENQWILSTLVLGLMIFFMLVITMMENKNELQVDTDDLVLPGLNEICLEMTGELNWKQCSYCLTTFEGLNESCFVVNKD